MRQFLRMAAGPWAIALTALLAASEASDEKTGAPGVYRIVLLAPTGPVLMDVHLETGSRSIRQVRDAFCETLFARLDVDQSGKLETAEQAHLPMFRRAGGSSGATPGAFLTAGNMLPDGLKKYIDGQLGPLFSVEVKPPRADQTVRLLEALDRDGDGVLSVDEVVHSTQALARFDLDDDESLSVNELQPFPRTVREGQRQQAVEEGRGSRVFLIENDSDRATAIKAIKDLYALEAVPVDRCGFGPASAGFDRNQDRLLDSGELLQWMQDDSATIELRAKWRETGRGLPPLLEVTTPATQRIAPVKGVSKTQWNATLDGVPIHVHLADNRGSAGFAVSLFVTKARTSDRDKNGYLDEAEFSGLGTSAPFSAVDLNHDGMVQTDEIRQYFESVSQLSQTRVVLKFGDNVASLFRLMDADSTNRLSPREMLTLRERITPFDRNNNGQFDSEDFISKYDVSIAFSIPEGMEFTPSAMMTGTTGGVKPTLRTGPLWYQRMDRNRDGDISWREFLGPRAKFDAIDTDHDGLISREEAEAVEGESVTTGTSVGPS